MTQRLFLCLVFVCLLLNSVKAQKTHAIEPANIEVRYAARYEGESVEKYGKLANTFVLRCGHTISQYFCYESFKTDSLSSNPENFHIWFEEHMKKWKNYEAGGDRPTDLPGSGDYLYRNLADSTVTTYTAIMGEHFRIVDKPVMVWNVEMDSFKTVAGYECHLATTHFRGRDWRVWFTLDIPLLLGPWKLSGLPGLILAAEVPGLMHMEAYQILTTNLSPVTFYNYWEKKSTDIDRAKFLKAKNSGAYPKGTIKLPQLETE